MWTDPFHINFAHILEKGDSLEEHLQKRTEVVGRQVAVVVANKLAYSCQSVDVFFGCIRLDCRNKEVRRKAGRAVLVGRRLDPCEIVDVVLEIGVFLQKIFTRGHDLMKKKTLLRGGLTGGRMKISNCRLHRLELVLDFGQGHKQLSRRVVVDDRSLRRRLALGIGIGIGIPLPAGPAFRIRIRSHKLVDGLPLLVMVLGALEETLALVGALGRHSLHFLGATDGAGRH